MILEHVNVISIPEAESIQPMNATPTPLVWQCRYGGVVVPDHLWAHCTTASENITAKNQANT
jgi:hypothetical protein